MTYELLKSQRAVIFQAIRDRGFDPRSFRWELADGEWSGWSDDTPRLVHVPTGFFCAFSVAPPDRSIARDIGRFQVLVSPGREIQQERVFGMGSFGDVLAVVEEWLPRILLESAPDPWEQLDEPQRLIVEVIEREPDNAPFTDAERARIAASLDDIRQLAVELQLSTTALRQLDAKIDFVGKAAKRMGRKDWFMLTVALLTYAVPPDKLGQLVQGVVHALQWIVHLPPLLP